MLPIAAWCLVAMLRAPEEGTPRLGDPAAQAHLDRGIAHWNAGELAEAAREIEAAHAIEPNPRLLAAWGKIERGRGDCPRAVELFRRYLATEPEPKGAEAARRHIVACGEDPDPPAPVEPTIEPPPARAATQQPTGTPPPAVEPVPTGPRRPPTRARGWQHDIAGGVLVGTGSAMVGAGIGLGIAAAIVDDRSADASTHDEYVDRERNAIAMQRAAIAVGTIGGALVVAGVARWAVLAARGRTKRDRRSADLGPAGVVVRF